MNNYNLSDRQIRSSPIDYLEHDFMVQQYIEQTSFNENLQSYTSLLNQVLYNNKAKRAQILYLDKQKQKYYQTDRQSADKSKISYQSNVFQKKMMEENEVKASLEAEVNQITKSINFLKGDIGRIIEKYEMTNILDKKTNKVKIVANDQLKKVRLAVVKDTSEMQERDKMQVRFKQKLKNICNTENASLHKVTTDYTHIEDIKNTVYAKIKRMAATIQHLNKNERIKEQINSIYSRNMQSLHELLSLKIAANIEDLHRLEEDDLRSKIGNTEQEAESLLSFKTEAFKRKIQEIETFIIKQIQKKFHSIQKLQLKYAGVTEQLCTDKQRLEEKEEQYVQYEEYINSSNPLRDISKMNQYNIKSVSFRNHIGLLFVIWGFIDNNSILTQKINSINSFTKNKIAKFENCLKISRKSEEFKRERQKYKENDYINQLHGLLKYLGGSTYDFELKREHILKEMEMSIILWLQGLKNVIIAARKGQQKDNIKLKKLKSLEMPKFKSTYQLISEEENERRPIKKYRISNTQSEIEKLKTMFDCIYPKQNIQTIEESKIAPTETCRESKSQVKAQRVKLLQKVDSDYYKMLKNVLTIEKQNTKNSYKFKKNFNRTKYAEKDLVQEEKRFEMGFALEFIRKTDRKDIQKTTLSDNSRIGVKETILKRRQHHHQTQILQDKLYDKNLDVKSTYDEQKIPPSIKTPKHSRFRTSVFYSKNSSLNLTDN